MTYKLGPFIEKITAPVICVFGDKEAEYADGKELSEQAFDKYWLVDSVSVRDGRIVLLMKENDQINTSDSDASFF